MQREVTMPLSKILITDNVVVNTGDAAILGGVMSLLRTAFPSAEIRIHCHYYNETHARYPTLPMRRALAESSRLHPPRFFWRFPAVNRYRIEAGRAAPWSAILRPLIVTGHERSGVADYRWADAIVSCGGSFLTDTYHIDHVLAGYELGLDLGKIMITLGQTLGPFADTRNLDTVGHVLSRFDLVALRDQRSGEMAKRMGVPPANIVTAADMAFNLTYVGRTDTHTVRRVPRVGVSVRRWIFPGVSDIENENEKYIARMVETLDSLVQQTGAEIVFVSTCQGVPSYAYRDEEVALKIHERLRHRDRAIIDRSFNTPEQYMEKIAGVDVLVGTRMHACILAMIAGTPAVNVEYEFKSRELFDRLGLADLIVSISDFEPRELVGKVASVLEDRESVKRRIAAGIGALRSENMAIAEQMQRRFG
jgi:colanic acid/amylovoran biosynthesis protein